MSEGKRIEKAVAASLILELFDGQTDVPRQEIERKVAKLYVSRSGVLESSLTAYPATYGLEHLISQRKAYSEPTGCWHIESAGVDTDSPKYRLFEQRRNIR